jgi:hypothetical protein
MIECINFRPRDKAGFLGYADIVDHETGWAIFSMTLHEKGSQKWVNMPQSSYEKNGEKKWLPYMKKHDSESHKDFLKQALEAVLKKRSEMMNDTIKVEGVPHD